MKLIDYVLWAYVLSIDTQEGVFFGLTDLCHRSNLQSSVYLYRHCLRIFDALKAAGAVR